VLLVGFLCGAAASDGLSPSEARRLVATMGGMNLPKDDVHIRKIEPGPLGGKQVIVEAVVQIAVQAAQQDGRWAVTAFRTGDRQWEEIELATTAVRKEKILRTTDDLREVARAVEAFRSERGAYPQAQDFPALIDHLTPKYLPRIIREDYWHRSYVYTPMPQGYRIESLGPDGKLGSGDELTIENGQLLSSSQKRGAD
jgi:hypothetical protein